MAPRQTIPAQPSSPTPTVDTTPRTICARPQANTWETEKDDELDEADTDDDRDYNLQADESPAQNDTCIGDLEPVNKAHIRAAMGYFFENCGDGKAACRLCKERGISKRYKASGKTKTRRLHLQTDHPVLYLDTARERCWMLGDMSIARSQATNEMTVSQGKQGDDAESDLTSFNKALVNWMLADNQLLNVVDCSELRSFVSLIRNKTTEPMIPEGTKLCELVVKTWASDFLNLKKKLQGAAGRVSFTMDVWCDHHCQQYLAVTAHWITESLRLETALIAFHHLNGKESLADVLLHLLDRAGVTLKVGYFTTNNSMIYKTAMEVIHPVLVGRDVPFDAPDHHVISFTNIFDSCAESVIHNLEAKDKTDDVPSDCINLARSVVGAVRASRSSQTSFNDILNDYIDKNGPVKKGESEDKQPRLLRDVKGRWDSVYLMLNRLRDLRVAINQYLTLPYNTEYKISPSSWFAMERAQLILAIMYTTQKKLSFKSRPTLCDAVPAFELLMDGWMKIDKGNGFKEFKKELQPGLELALTHYHPMSNTLAYIMSAFLNPAIRAFEGVDWNQNLPKDVREAILRLMRDYRAKSVDKTQSQSSTEAIRDSTPNNGSNSSEPLLAIYGLDNLTYMDLGNSSASVPTVEQEYDTYVMGSRSHVVDIVDFWNRNRSTFPTLFAIAMDYIPIQGVAIPCERIVSSRYCTEVGMKKGNYINPVAMEVSQMLKFNSKDGFPSFTEGWITPEELMVEGGPDEDLLGKLVDGRQDDGDLDTVIQYICRP